VNVGQGQRMDEVSTFLAPAAVFDHIALALTWRRIAPIGKGSNGHPLPDRRARAPTAPPRAAGGFALWAQQSIDGGGTNAAQWFLAPRRAGAGRGAPWNRSEPG
jgi:hypothetical protein